MRLQHLASGLFDGQRLLLLAASQLAGTAATGSHRAHWPAASAADLPRAQSTKLSSSTGHAWLSSKLLRLGLTCSQPRCPVMTQQV